MKLARWHKGIVEWAEGDTAYLSVVFSWHADDAYQRAIWHRASGRRVRIGGPAIHVMGRKLVGVAEIGGDIPDAVIRHNPMATYASRGCPVGCWFCIVPSMEGREFTLIDNFTPRPILCDNNLSALPREYQAHIVDRYTQAGVPLLDANSGFEPRTFDEDIYQLWHPIMRGPWRLAFDDQGDRPHVERALRILRDVPQRRKRIYVLIGNEPMASCLDRINQVVAWGGDPHAQPIIKLNARHKKPWVRHDWSEQSLIDMARWTNRHLWKYAAFAEYKRGSRPANRSSREGTTRAKEVPMP